MELFKSLALKAKAAQHGASKYTHELKCVQMTQKGAKALVITPWGAPWSPDTPEPLIYELSKEEGTWKIKSLEGICFPIFGVKEGDTLTPPSLPLNQVRWMNTEFGWSVAARESLYQLIEHEKGEKTAKEHLRSYAKGMAVAVKAWVPFVEGPAQLAVYDATLRCNIHGSQAKVEVVTENDVKLTYANCLEAKVADIAVMKFSRQVTRNEYCEHCTIIFMAVVEQLGLKAKRQLTKNNKGNFGCCTFISY